MITLVKLFFMNLMLRFLRLFQKDATIIDYTILPFGLTVDEELLRSGVVKYVSCDSIAQTVVARIRGTDLLVWYRHTLAAQLIEQINFEETKRTVTKLLDRLMCKKAYDDLQSDASLTGAAVMERARTMFPDFYQRENYSFNLVPYMKFQDKIAM